MQQMAANKAQHNNEHTQMLQHFAMMTRNHPGPQQFVGQLSGQANYRPQVGTQRNYHANQVRIMVGGNSINYPGELAIPILAPVQQ